MVGTLVPTDSRLRVTKMQNYWWLIRYTYWRIVISAYKEQKKYATYIFQPDTDFEWIPGADLSNMYMY